MNGWNDNAEAEITRVTVFLFEPTLFSMVVVGV